MIIAILVKGIPCVNIKKFYIEVISGTQLFASSQLEYEMHAKFLAAKCLCPCVMPHFLVMEIQLVRISHPGPRWIGMGINVWHELILSC